MTDEIETAETKQNLIQEVNEIYLAGFEKWLKNKGLSQKTINMHVSNLEFFINEYVCYYFMLDASHGLHYVYEFLGDWFIRKATWSSCAHIKSNAAGINKFYAYLLEENIIKQADYDDMCGVIKKFMPYWLAEMKRYDAMIFGEYY